MITLGIDLSTQGVKALVYDSHARRVIVKEGVNFGRDMLQFGCPDGFLPLEGVRHADPWMWLAGLYLVLARLNKVFDLSRIEAIGGDAQQHASVYLDGQGGFSREACPIWMDSSTTIECRELTARFGDELRRKTGSPAIERFTGPQIRKFFKTEPEAYARTKRIHLASSFICSVLAGETAPIDTGDGAGMNLLDLSTLDWDREICDFTAPGLWDRLPPIYRPGDGCKLRLAAGYAKFGLRPGIPVVPFTGDNPASLVGTGADVPGVAVISLGTSDVFFAAMPDFKTDPDGYGHVFGNPSGGFMSLACFKNGSLARERVRRQLNVDYEFFDETAFAETSPGNGGRRAFPYFEEEITPVHPASGIEANFDWAAASAATKVRAVIEGQIGNMYERTRWIGKFDTIRVTGGASRSKGIRETIASIFGAKVETLETPNSAALGGAILASRI